MKKKLNVTISDRYGGQYPKNACRRCDGMGFYPKQDKNGKWHDVICPKCKGKKTSHR